MEVSGSTKSCSCICIIGVLLGAFIILPQACFADRGGWHIHTEPVTLKESGQRAIIGWDGEIEILCLGTDVSSSRKTTVIEFLPLPSEPKVTLGSTEAFEAVEKVLARRNLRFFKEGQRLGKGLRGDARESEPFTITFHQRLGAHDVTVIKVNRPDEFVDWVEEKARALTQNKTSVPDGLRKLIAKYLNEYNCPYFVFDVIEVGPEPKSVEPIIYEFRYPFLFYPLEISSTFHGKTTIDLIVFSEDLVHQDPFLDLDFQLSSATNVDGADMDEVLPRLKELLGETAFIQAFRYNGDIRSLAGNIKVGLQRKNLAYTSGQYKRGLFGAFYSGVFAAILGGVVIAFLSLLPMYFVAKRQRPRWGLRFLAGFLLGMPLGFGLIFAVVNLLRAIDPTSQLFPRTYYYYNYSVNPVILIACSMGMGFIIFCFQLGLRRHWYLWYLVYAALAIPATFMTDPDRIEDLFERIAWITLWDKIAYVFLTYFLVFTLLFLIARLLIWITSLCRKAGSSLSEQSNP